MSWITTAAKKVVNVAYEFTPYAATKVKAVAAGALNAVGTAFKNNPYQATKAVAVTTVTAPIVTGYVSNNGLFNTASDLYGVGKNLNELGTDASKVSSGEMSPTEFVKEHPIATGAGAALGVYGLSKVIGGGASAYLLGKGLGSQDKSTKETPVDNINYYQGSNQQLRDIENTVTNKYDVLVAKQKAEAESELQKLKSKTEKDIAEMNFALQEAKLKYEMKIFDTYNNQPGAYGGLNTGLFQTIQETPTQVVAPVETKPITTPTKKTTKKKTTKKKTTKKKTTKKKTTKKSNRSVPKVKKKKTTKHLNS